MPRRGRGGKRNARTESGGLNEVGAGEAGPATDRDVPIAKIDQDAAVVDQYVDDALTKDLTIALDHEFGVMNETQRATPAFLEGMVCIATVVCLWVGASELIREEGTASCHLQTHLAHVHVMHVMSGKS